MEEFTVKFGNELLNLLICLAVEISVLFATVAQLVENTTNSPGIDFEDIIALPPSLGLSNRLTFVSWNAEHFRREVAQRSEAVCPCLGVVAFIYEHI